MDLDFAIVLEGKKMLSYTQRNMVPSITIPQNLAVIYEMDLNFWDCFEREKKLFGIGLKGKNCLKTKK